MKKIRTTAIIFIITYLLTLFPFQALSATVGDIIYYSGEWNGKNWVMGDMYIMEDGTMEPVAYVNENNNLVVRSVDGINKRVIAKYPDSIKSNGQPDDYDSENLVTFMDDKEFDVNFRARFDGQFNVMVRCTHTAFRLSFKSDSFIVFDDGASNYNAAPLQTDNKWHDYSLKIRGQNCLKITPKQCLAHARLYMDGKEVMNFCTEKYYPAAYRGVMFYADYNYDFASTVEVAYCDIVNRHTTTQILSPLSGTEYEYGEKITLSADGGATDDETKNVDFYIGDIKVGSGTDTKKANATLVLPTLEPGTYSVTSKCGDVESADVIFTVKNPENLDLITGSELEYGNTLKLKVDTESIDSVENIEFYLDGNLIANAQYSASYEGVSVGTHSLWAKVFASDGKIYETDINKVNVSSYEYKNIDFGQEYMLDYTSQGDGQVNVNDGFFKLFLSHSLDGLSYLDSDGAVKKYTGKLGGGDYRVVTTSGYAEVYYEGQFVFSYLMPNSDEQKDISASGIENLKISATGVKGTILASETNSDGNFGQTLPDFGLYYSFEFEKKDKSKKNILVYDGTFETELLFDEDGIYVNNQPTNGARTEKKKLSEIFEPGYYRVTVGHGMAQLFCNNVIVGSFRCPMKSHGPSVYVMGRVGESFALKYSDDIYYHYEDFEETGEDGFLYSDYWYSESDALTNGIVPDFTHATEADNGNTYLKLSGSGDYLLNAISDNHIFRWKGYYTPGEGEVYALFRYMDLCDYGRVGYDGSDNLWKIIKASKTTGSIYDTEDLDGDGDTTEVLKTGTIPGETLIASEMGSLKEGWHNFELHMNGTNVSLWCDGRKVVTTDSYGEGFGRVGFGVKNAQSFVDNVDYAGCGKAAAGVSFLTDGGADFYQNFKGEILSVSNYGNVRYYKSADNGETWTKVEYDGNTSIGARSGNNIRLLSGKFLRAMMSGKYTYAYLYDPADSPNTETTPSTSKGSLIEPAGTFDTVPYSCMPARLMQVQSGPYKGRVFFCRGGSDETRGKTFMFYTDDYIDPNFKGKATWHEPNVQPSYINTGVNVQESQMVDMPDGTLRYYMRTDRGYMYYLVSEDGGETWDVNEQYNENLISPLCCYSIQRVGDTSTYYAYFEYDTVTSSQVWLGQPRNRRALTVSYDGMKTWQYVADIEEDTYGPGNSKSVCNHGMRVVNGAVYMSYYLAPDMHKMYRQDISKIKPLLRFTSLHFRKPGYLSSNDYVYENSAIPKQGGEAYISGGYRQSFVSDEGFIDAKTLSASVGANVEFDGNKVCVNLMETDIVFESDTDKYTVNGTEKSLGEIACRDGFLNPLVISRVFGKHLHTDNDFWVISDQELSTSLLMQTKAMACGDDVTDAFSDAFVWAVNDASQTSDSKATEFAFDKYSDIIGFDNSDAENESEVYSSMVNADYSDCTMIIETFEKASENLGLNRDGKGLVFGTNISGYDGFVLSDFSSVNSDGSLSIRHNPGESTGETVSALGIDTKDDFIMSFDFKRLSGDANLNVSFGNGNYGAVVSVNEYEIGFVGEGHNKNDFHTQRDTWYRITVTSEWGFLSAKLSEVGVEGSEIVLSDFLFPEYDYSDGFIISTSGQSVGEYAIRNVRVYDECAFDVSGVEIKDGSVLARVDVLNGFGKAPSGNVIMALYSENRLLAVSSAVAITTSSAEYETITVDIPETEYDAKSKVTKVKFFYWNSVDGLKPVFAEVGK